MLGMSNDYLFLPIFHHGCVWRRKPIQDWFLSMRSFFSGGGGGRVRDVRVIHYVLSNERVKCALHCPILELTIDIKCRAYCFQHSDDQWWWWMPGESRRCTARMLRLGPRRSSRVQSSRVPTFSILTPILFESCCFALHNRAILRLSHFGAQIFKQNVSFWYFDTCPQVVSIGCSMNLQRSVPPNFMYGHFV